MSYSNLSQMFSPLSRLEFLESYLKNEPLVTHNVSDLESLFAHPLYESLESLFQQWPGPVNAYQEGTADEVNASPVSCAEARELFQTKGSGLYFDDPNLFDSTIDRFLQELRLDLGLSNLTYSRSLIYAIAKGKGTATHFDQNINFVLQISGTKKWWIADNQSVENPLMRHTLGHTADPELESYITAPFPTEIPKDAREYVLQPGSVLFLPRGCWHKTEALSDAISLNFTYSAPSWLDLMTAAIRSRLVQSPQWRETANFVNDETLKPHAHDQFDRLISEFVEDTKSWRAGDILGATESN